MHEISENEARELYAVAKEALEEPDDTVAAFRYTVSEIRNKELKEGARFDIANDAYLMAYPEGIFYVEYDDENNKEPHQIGINEACSLIYDFYFLSEGLEKIVAACRITGESRTYLTGEKKICFVTDKERHVEVYVSDI